MFKSIEISSSEPTHCILHGMFWVLVAFTPPLSGYLDLIIGTGSWGSVFLDRVCLERVAI